MKAKNNMCVVNVLYSKNNIKLQFHSVREEGSQSRNADVVSYHSSLIWIQFNSIKFQSKLLYHTPVMGTHFSYQLGCLGQKVNR